MWNFKGFSFNLNFGGGNNDKYKDGEDNEANKKKDKEESNKKDFDDLIGKKKGTDMADDFLSKFNKRDYILENQKQIAKN